MPNAHSSKWLERGARSSSGARPIDVLVQRRKTSRYVLDQLVPELRRAGLTVEVQSGWVDDLVDLFNSATVVLYDSADYWRGRGVSEGFGLPPIEALACGILRASDTIMAMACSAAVTVLPPGVFMTTMPCLLAAGISMLSTPAPARPMATSLVAASMISAVALVDERTIRAS